MAVASGDGIAHLLTPVGGSCGVERKNSGQWSVASECKARRPRGKRKTPEQSHFRPAEWGVGGEKTGWWS